MEPKMFPEIIELHTTELCNRKCSFCPRGDGYPNLNQNISLEDAQILFDKIKEYNYRCKEGEETGNFHITGSGEPTLNPNFVEIVKLFRKNKDIKIKMTTNGDYIGKKDFSWFEYFDEIRISIYDGDDRYEEVKKLTKDYSMVDIRKQYETALTGTFNNCGGWFPVDNIPDKPCFIPFYRLQVDWNLDIRLCCHDWKEKVVVANLKDDSLHNIWHESFREYREELIKNNRKNISPCNKCNVNGTLNIYTKRESGKQHFNFFKDYYDKF